LFYLFAKYHFDYFIREHSTRIKPDKQLWISEFFYDSVNQKSLSIKVKNDKIIASIFDKENNRRHVFKVIKLKDKLTFVYKHSNQYPQNQNKKKFDYNQENVIKVEKIDSLQFKITVYKNSKLKRKKIAAIVTLEKSEFDLINFNLEYSRTDEINKNIKSLLNSEFNYIINSQQVEYKTSGYIFENAIQKIEKIDLTIILPEKLTFKQTDYWSDFED